MDIQEVIVQGVEALEEATQVVVAIEGLLVEAVILLGLHQGLVAIVGLLLELVILDLQHEPIMDTNSIKAEAAGSLCIGE